MGSWSCWGWHSATTRLVWQDSEAIIPGEFTGPIKSRAFSPPLRLLDALKMNKQSSNMEERGDELGALSDMSAAIF